MADKVIKREEGIKMQPYIVLTNEKMSCLCIVKFPHGTKNEEILEKVQKQLSGYSYGFIDNSGEFLQGNYFKVFATSHDDAKGKCFRQMYKEVSKFWEIMNKPNKLTYHYNSLDDMVECQTFQLSFAPKEEVTVPEGRKLFRLFTKFVRSSTFPRTPTSGRQ